MQEREWTRWPSTGWLKLYLGGGAISSHVPGMAFARASPVADRPSTPSTAPTGLNQDLSSALQRPSGDRSTARF